MVPKGSVVGIDFGTTNSTIARCIDPSSKVEIVRFPLFGGETESYRSLLYLERLRQDGKNRPISWTGPAGIEHYLSKEIEGETGGRLIQSLKSFLTSSLTVERLFQGWVARVGYSGSKSDYLQDTIPENVLAPGLFTPPTTLAQQQAQQASGLYSSLNSGLSGSPTSRSNRVDGRFNNVSVVTSGATSSYNSLQAQLSRRFTGWYGFSFGIHLVQVD
jgi:hypothetical protein